MGLAQTLVVGHHHDHDSGGVITHPRPYELFANAWFLGQRTRVFDRLVDASGARPGDSVLDIGCGTGYFSRRIARAVMPDGAVVGIDPSEPMLDYARRAAPANCSFRAAGAEDLPFADASFDQIVSSLAFHHIPTEHRGDAMAHNITDQLRQLVSDAGFTIAGSGDLPLLRYISAQRPERR